FRPFELWSQSSESPCSLGEYLEGMPVCPFHRVEYLSDVVIWYLTMKHIAHRIHEKTLWGLYLQGIFHPLWKQLYPVKRLVILFWHRYPTGVGIMSHIVEGKGITSVTTSGNACASCYGIPASICPFNR